MLHHDHPRLWDALEQTRALYHGSRGIVPLENALRHNYAVALLDLSRALQRDQDGISARARLAITHSQTMLQRYNSIWRNC